MTAILDQAATQSRLHLWTVEEYHRMIETGILANC